MKSTKVICSWGGGEGKNNQGVAQHPFWAHPLETKDLLIQGELSPIAPPPPEYAFEFD